MRVILDILKTFNKVWLHKLSSYNITGRVFSVIKSFLSGRSMKVVNGQSSEAHEINVGILQSPLIYSTLFLLYLVGTDCTQSAYNEMFLDH